MSSPRVRRSPMLEQPDLETLLQKAGYADAKADLSVRGGPGAEYIVSMYEFNAAKNKKDEGAADLNEVPINVLLDEKIRALGSNPGKITLLLNTLHRYSQPENTKDNLEDLHKKAKEARAKVGTEKAGPSRSKAEREALAAEKSAKDAQEKFDRKETHLATHWVLLELDVNAAGKITKSTITDSMDLQAKHSNHHRVIHDGLKALNLLASGYQIDSKNSPLLQQDEVNCGYIAFANFIASMPEQAESNNKLISDIEKIIPKNTGEVDEVYASDAKKKKIADLITICDAHLSGIEIPITPSVKPTTATPPQKSAPKPPTADETQLNYIRKNEQAAATEAENIRKRDIENISSKLLSSTIPVQADNAIIAQYLQNTDATIKRLHQTLPGINGNRANIVENKTLINLLEQCHQSVVNLVYSRAELTDANSEALLNKYNEIERPLIRAQNILTALADSNAASQAQLLEITKQSKAIADAIDLITAKRTSSLELIEKNKSEISRDINASTIRGIYSEILYDGDYIDVRTTQGYAYYKDSNNEAHVFDYDSEKPVASISSGFPTSKGDAKTTITRLTGKLRADSTDDVRVVTNRTISSNNNHVKSQVFINPQDINAMKKAIPLTPDSPLMELAAQMLNDHIAKLDSKLRNEPITLNSHNMPEALAAAIMVYADFKGIKLNGLTEAQKERRDGLYVNLKYASVTLKPGASYLGIQSPHPVRVKNAPAFHGVFMDEFIKQWKEKHPEDIGLEENSQLSEAMRADARADYDVSANPAAPTSPSASTPGAPSTPGGPTAGAAGSSPVAAGATSPAAPATSAASPAPAAATGKPTSPTPNKSGSWFSNPIGFGSKSSPTSVSSAASHASTPSPESDSSSAVAPAPESPRPAKAPNPFGGGDFGASYDAPDPSLPLPTTPPARRGK